MKELTTVLVPYKSRGVKSRLSPLIGQRGRDDFSMALLKHVLSTLKRASLADRSYVVTPSPSARSTAERLGVRVVREDFDGGVNAAVRLAMDRLEGTGFLVLPSDLPLLSPRDLRRALDLKASGLDVVMAPSRAFDGTNLLAFSRDLMPDLSYDTNSFWNHLASGARLGLKVGVLTQLGVTFDVDTPDDLQFLARLRINMGPVSFARKVLRSSSS